MMQYYSVADDKSARLTKRKRKPSPYKWLRDLTSSIDIGQRKVREGAKYVPHLNTIKDVLSAFNRGQWWKVDRLTNADYDDHFAGCKDFYFTAGKGERVLVMGAVDCKRFGSLAGALAYCEFLSQTYLPGLYYEVSTNGNGAHFYVIVEKDWLGAESVNDLLLHHLAPHLNKLAAGFDIEFVEVKGTLPVLGWGEAKGELRTYRCGCLAKLPRDVSRFDQWQRTTVIHAGDLMKLPVGKGPMSNGARSVARDSATAAQSAVAEAADHVQRGKRQKGEGRTSLRGTAATSCSGALIDDVEIARISTSYRQVAEQIMGGKSLKTCGKHVATAEDMAILLCVVKLCTLNMNDDGTLPFGRIKGLWTALKEAGDVQRPFDNKRYGAMRDHLSVLGLLDWEDNTYVVGGNGKEGRACKWRFSAKLMEMLSPDVMGEGRTSLRGTPATEALQSPERTAVLTAGTIEGERGDTLEGHSAPETDEFLRPEQVITTFDYLLADEMVDQIITGWGESVLAA